jgi:hypothetical protein
MLLTGIVSGHERRSRSCEILMNSNDTRSTLPVWLRAAARGAALMLSAALIVPSAHAGDVNGVPTNETPPALDVPEPTALEWSLLDSSIPVTLEKSVKSTPSTTLSGANASWNRTTNDDGGSAVTVKQSVLPFWDTKVGADMNVASNTPLTSGDVWARKAIGDTQSMQSTGSAWANMTAPGLGNIWDKTSIEARVDPSQEQSKVSTSVSKTMPIGSQPYAVTVQGGYNIIDSAVPLVGVNGRPTNRAAELDQQTKLEFKDTGTSLLAGQTMSTMDDKWLRRIGAEQKLFGGVSVTGAVSQTADGTASKSVTAGYKYNW